MQQPARAKIKGGEAVQARLIAERTRNDNRTRAFCDRKYPGTRPVNVRGCVKQVITRSYRHIRLTDARR